MLRSLPQPPEDQGCKVPEKRMFSMHPLEAQEGFIRQKFYYTLREIECQPKVGGQNFLERNISASLEVKTLWKSSSYP